MSGARIVVAHLVLVALVGGSAYDIASGLEHWPFSPYPMYSELETHGALLTQMLVGVTAEGANEIPLRDARFIEPFDPSRLSTVLVKLWRSKDRVRLKAAVRDCLVRYESLRVSGRHEGPRLQAMRFYEVAWDLDPWARNVDRPDARKLVVEVELGKHE